MPETKNKIKKIVAAIAPPFATGSFLLLVILSFVEYFRRGFVSLFFDLRPLAALVIILWGLAVWSEAAPRRRWLSAIMPTLILLAILPVLYKMLAPDGRLGLLTFAAGAASIVLIMITIWTEPKT